LEIFAMLWMRKHIAEIVLNMVALIIFASLAYEIHNLIQGEWLAITTYPNNNVSGYTEVIAGHAFRSIGHWAIRFLMLSLAMSPIYTYFGWKTALRLRKPAGLWAFAFVGLHVWLFFLDSFWGKVWGQPYVYYGLVAIIILALLAATSIRPAMRLLGRNWKRLHRLVYAAGVLGMLHGLLSFNHWKLGPNGEWYLLETRILAVLLVILLVVRSQWCEHGSGVRHARKKQSRNTSAQWIENQLNRRDAENAKKM
jgi:methionine sulfoxide reductase heme-binding subunit